MKEALYAVYKFVPLLLYPAGMTFLLSLASLVALALKKKGRALFLVVLALTVFTVSALPVTSHVLTRSLEGQYLPQAEYSKASAIVLLGGAEVPPEPPRIHPETNVNGDRILHAARLYRQGAAPYIIPTGGKYRKLKHYRGTAAEVNAALLVELFGVPQEAILLEGESRTTGDHGRLVRAILEEKGLPLEVLLVTSASHMPRSVRVFEKAGFTLHPAPTDFSADEEFLWEVRSFIPTAEALDGTTRAVHEYYGLIAYRLLGWIN
jgi:uncharacterized SAM-binding protein YcdF (DUF218 family)